jgi:ribosomal protein L37AE/L43A
MQPMAATERLERHRLGLIARHRCPDCAEHRTTRELIAGGACPHCGKGAGVAMDLERRLELALGKARTHRLVAYLAVGAAAVVAGWLPLLATLTTLIAMLVMRRSLLRGATAWLSPRRRVVTKLLLRQWMVICALLMLLIDEIVTLLPIPGWPLRVLSAVAAAALYAEISLIIANARIRRDERSPELDVWEWLLPVGGALAMLLAAGAAAATLVAAYAALDGAFGWVMGLVGVAS